MWKLTDSLNSGIGVECLGNGGELVQMGGKGGVIPFYAPKTEGLLKILQPFVRGHVFLCIPISFLQKKTLKESKCQILFIFKMIA